MQAIIEQLASMPDPGPYEPGDAEWATIRAAFAHYGIDESQALGPRVDGGYVWWRDADDRAHSCPVLLTADEVQRRALAEADAQLAERWFAFRNATVQGWHTGTGAAAVKRKAVKSAVAEWGRAWIDAWDKPDGCDTPRVLVLAGDPGCGKTHIGIALVRALVSRGARPNTGRGAGYTAPSFAAWNVQDLIMAHRATWTDKRARDPLLDCRVADVLMLDDLGAHKTTVAAAEMLYQLVDARYRNARGVMIVTTNSGALAGGGVDAFWRSLLTGDEEAAPLLSRVSSRLAEHSALVPFGSVSGGGFDALPDWRRGGA